MDILLKFPYTQQGITFEQGNIFKDVRKNSNGYETQVIIKDWFEYYGNTWYTGGKGPHPHWKIGINWTHTNLFIPLKYAEEI